MLNNVHGRLARTTVTNTNTTSPDKAEMADISGRTLSGWRLAVGGWRLAVALLAALTLNSKPVNGIVFGMRPMQVQQLVFHLLPFYIYINNLMIFSVTQRG